VAPVSKMERGGPLHRGPLGSGANEYEKHAFAVLKYAARLALKDLPPGAYVLTVSAQSRLGDTPAAERQVPFTVTAASR